MNSQRTRSRLLALTVLGSIFVTGGCVTEGPKNADGTPVLQKPSGDKPRLFDCMGQNQTSDGTTREDCLPNDADAAARDTEAGAGAGDADGTLFP